MQRAAWNPIARLTKAFLAAQRRHLFDNRLRARLPAIDAAASAAWSAGPIGLSIAARTRSSDPPPSRDAWSEPVERAATPGSLEIGEYALEIASDARKFSRASSRGAPPHRVRLGMP